MSIVIGTTIRGKTPLTKGAKIKDIKSVGGRMLGCLCNNYYALKFENNTDEVNLLKRCRYYGMNVCRVQKTKYNYRLWIANRVSELSKAGNSNKIV